jgi:hypothetical protein
MKRMIALFGVVLTLALTVAALAQGRFNGLDTTARGDGTLRQDRFRDERITQVRITLRRNGDAEIQIEGDMPTVTYTGRWSEGFTDAINLNINRSSGGSNTSATGKIYLRRGEFDRLEIDGRRGGDRFAVSFTARRGGGGNFPGGNSPGGGYNDPNLGGRGYSVEAARRAIEEQLYRERRERVEVTFDRADTYFVSNGEEGVRGTGRARFGNRDWEAFRFDSAVDTRQGRVTRVNYEFENRGGPVYGDPASSFREGRYEIQLVNTGRLLEVGRDGVTVQQASASGARTQQWDFDSAGNGYYFIRSAGGGVMTVEGNGENGSSVLVAPRRRTVENQLWEIRPGPDRGFYLISKLGRALDSPSSARFEGGRMQVYSANGEANQRFRLREVERRDDDFGGNHPWPGGGDSRAGSVRWRGRVDDVVQLEVRGAAITERTISGSSFNNGRYTFTSPLPRREASLTLDRRKARGQVEIIERPSPANGYTAVIEIRDTQGGAADYEFDLRWN